jgi:hypothetical protein
MRHGRGFFGGRRLARTFDYPHRMVDNNRAAQCPTSRIRTPEADCSMDLLRPGQVQSEANKPTKAVISRFNCRPDTNAMNRSDIFAGRSTFQEIDGQWRPSHAASSSYGISMFHVDLTTLKQLTLPVHDSSQSRNKS